MLGYLDPRARTGRDNTSDAVQKIVQDFDPRAHRGRDRRKIQICAAIFTFLPTRPQGARRPGKGFRRVCQNISTHAPTGGATANSFDIPMIFIFPNCNNRKAENKINDTPICDKVRTPLQTHVCYRFAPCLYYIIFLTKGKRKWSVSRTSGYITKQVQLSFFFRFLNILNIFIINKSKYINQRSHFIR